MGLELYRKGKTHVIRGVECEMINVPYSRFKAHVEQGWKTELESINVEESEEFKKADTNKTGKLSNKEIRAAAKSAGIKNYKSARITTLKEELGL